MARIRKKLSAVVLWCTFVALYLGGAVMLMIGFYIACGDWWTAIHHHAGRWAVGTKTAELFVLLLGLILVLIIPVFERKSVDRSGAWKTGRRSESKGQASGLGKGCITIP
ncbi:MAG TPA: hypothetical protein VFQ24_17075 [Terriglobia bacterium]|nr:hypothetical protein [Terriglobia bacterium]